MALACLLVALAAGLAALCLLRFPRYAVGATVWCVDPAKGEALEGTVKAVTRDDYILTVPALAREKVTEFYISKRQVRKYLRPRTTETNV